MRCAGENAEHGVLLLGRRMFGAHAQYKEKMGDDRRSKVVRSPLD